MCFIYFTISPGLAGFVGFPVSMNTYKTFFFTRGESRMNVYIASSHSFFKIIAIQGGGETICLFSCRVLILCLYFYSLDLYV